MNHKNQRWISTFTSWLNYNNLSIFCFWSVAIKQYASWYVWQPFHVTEPNHTFVWSERDSARIKNFNNSDRNKWCGLVICLLRFSFPFHRFSETSKRTIERGTERLTDAQNNLNHKNKRNKNPKPNQSKVKLLWVYWTDTKIEFSFHIRRKQIIEREWEKKRERKNDNHYDRDFQKNHLTKLPKKLNRSSCIQP